MEGRASVATAGRRAGEMRPHERAGAALVAAYDWKHDAFGGPPFVPQPEVAEFLVALGLRTGMPLALKAGLRSLAVLPQSELADPVEGGFFDRCAGPGWRGPHTRKSLSANAALLSAMATAAKWTGDESLGHAALATADFIELHLMADEGDLWAEAQGPDDEYFERMAHARAKRGAPPTTGPASKAEAARTISAFARAGLCLEEPRLIGRARLALRELWGEPAAEAPEEEPWALLAGFDLFLATADRKWLSGAIKRVASVSRRGGFEAAQPTTEARLGAMALGARLAASDHRGAAQLEETLAGWSPPPGDLPAMALWGAAFLAADAPRVTITWKGPAIPEAGAEAARAALGLAWALGPPGLDATVAKRSASDPPELFFSCGGRQGAQCAEARALGAALRGVIDLKEGL